MRKIVIFVEGQTELIFVREYLMKWFEWKLDIDCMQIRGSGEPYNVDYPIENPSADNHFLIIDVQGDINVLKTMTRQAPFYWNKGYEKVVGLRDLYGEQYKKILAKRNKTQQIDEKVNQEIITINNEEVEIFLKENAKDISQMKMCFAVMEVEAWILAMPHIFQRIDKKLTNDFILKQLGIDLVNINPETYFHPANQLKDILALAEIRYDKQKNHIEKLVGKIDKQDFENLLQSTHCQSFNIFHQTVIT